MIVIRCFAIIFALAFALLIQQPAFAQNDFDIERFVTEKYYQGNASAYTHAKEGHDVRFCGEYVLVYYIMGTLDGPTYLLKKSDGSLVATCGGACMRPQADEEKEICRTLCRPLTASCK